MKIIDIKNIVFPDVKVIKYGRFPDDRGYFNELYKRSDFQNIDFLKDQNFVQNNESYSKKGVIRGLHFQWNPFMSKLVRVVSGSMVDLFLDIKIGSPTFGKIAGYKLDANPSNNYGEWIFVPVGYAHGLYLLEDSIVEYYCTAEYAPLNEASISPLATDIDWSLADPAITSSYKNSLVNANISKKDREGFTLSAWTKDPRSNFFK